MLWYGMLHPSALFNRERIIPYYSEAVIKQLGSQMEVIRLC